MCRGIYDGRSLDLRFRNRAFLCWFSVTKPWVKPKAKPKAQPWVVPPSSRRLHTCIAAISPGLGVGSVGQRRAAKGSGVRVANSKRASTALIVRRTSWLGLGAWGRLRAGDRRSTLFFLPPLRGRHDPRPSHEQSPCGAVTSPPQPLPTTPTHPTAPRLLPSPPTGTCNNI